VDEGVAVPASEDRLERETPGLLQDREVAAGARLGAGDVDLQIADDVPGPRYAVVEEHRVEHPPDLGGPPANLRRGGGTERRAGEERRDPIQVAGVEALGIGVDEGGDSCPSIGHTPP
jgi:hypothetical protein